MNLTFRRLERNDLSTRVEWCNDKRIYQQMPLDFPYSLSETKEWYQSTLMSDARDDFSIEQNDELVSMCGLENIDHSNKRAELYLLVDPNKTGQGIGTKVLRWLCNFGFVKYDLHKIYLHTVEDNSGARQFYEQSGFNQEGVLRSHLYHNGAFVDRYIHALLHEEWESLQWSDTEIQLSID